MCCDIDNYIFDENDQFAKKNKIFLRLSTVTKKNIKQYSFYIISFY